MRLGGQDLTHASVASRGCGIVFQSYALFPHMRVWENIAYPLRVRGVAVEQRRRKAEEMLEMVGLSGTAERLPAQLSGGQQQRVALARALAFEPRALLLDEPLSALDAATRVVMRDEVRRIQKMHNIAALLITHDQDEALSLADRIAVLKDGRLVQYDTPAAIYDRPADGFVAGFVGRANVLAGTASGPEQVDVPFGRLQTLPHGLRQRRGDHGADTAGTAGAGRAGESGSNLFEVRVLKDRFFGATRQLDMTIGEAVLKLETTSRAALTRVRVPVEAIQFLPTRDQEHCMNKLKRFLCAAAVSMVSALALAQNVTDSPELYPGREGALRGRQQGRHGGQLRHRADLGQLGGAVRGLQEALPRGRDRLQRPRLGRHRGGAGQGAQPPAGRHRLLLRRLGVDAVDKGVVAPFKPVNFDKLPGVFREPEGRWFTIHYADDRLHRQHQAGEERAAAPGPICSSPSTRTRSSISTRAPPASAR